MSVILFLLVVFGMPGHHRLTFKPSAFHVALASLPASFLIFDSRRHVASVSFVDISGVSMSVDVFGFNPKAAPDFASRNGGHPIRMWVLEMVFPSHESVLHSDGEGARLLNYIDFDG